jgi:hypothetical protein
MQTMEVALNGLIEQGLVSYEDALDRSMFPKEIKQAPVAAGAYR